MTAPPPEGEGAARCMVMALRTGRLNTSDISYINAHGTSTPLGDICETKAIKSVFGDYARKLSVSSTKSMTGHHLGAAGSIEMAVCAKAIHEDKIPPTINLDNPDPQCDLDYVPKVARESRVNAILNNSFGFGGHNACIAARKLS
jgi:3-oxoacyl-[acyl-carrier-protein] synthase II